jgi:surfactin family lipopeptide synthetase C
MTVQNQNEIYPLTPTQQAMLVYSLYAPESPAYFEQVCYSYQGPLDPKAFSQAWQQVVDRHVILRTGFPSDDTERIVQVVYWHAALPFEQHDWRTLSETQRRERLDKFLRDDSRRGFDLSNPPLIRVAVLQTEDDAYWIVVSNHHIILDGWSMSVVRNEVSQVYQKLTHQKVIELKPAHPFSDYLTWLGKKNAGEAENFWRRELSGFVTPNKLPIDNAAGKLPGPNEDFDEKELSLSASVTTAIQACARRHHLTMSAFLQGAWAMLVSRYCGVEDVVFGITVSGRPYDLAGVESLVGLLINTLPIRIEIKRDESCLSCLKKVQSRVGGLLEHEHSSLKQIQEWSDVPRDLPLFETLMVFENFAGAGSAFDLDGSIQVSRSHLSRTNYPLTLVVDPGSQLRLQVVYHRSRFAGDAIDRMLAHLSSVLEAIVSDVEQPVASLQLLSEAERQTVLVDWNNTSKEFPYDEPIKRLFERQVELTPDAVAVVHEGRRVTYSELNRRANQLAHYLKEFDVGPESLVGVCIERSIEMLMAVLATHKAGGAYVPLDPSYPKDRLAFMLNDSGVRVLLTQGRLLERLPDYDGKAVCLDEDAHLIDAYSAENPSQAATSTDLAYVIYTSGSTGNPKGTLIEHRSLVNFVKAAVEEYEIAPGDRVLQFASLSFDTSAEEIFPALIAGASLVLRTDTMLSSAEDFLRSCNEFGVTVLDLPTAYWHELTDELCADNLSLPESLRLIILGGEKALPERLSSWRKRAGDSVRLVNTYGPTETTIVATMCDLSAEEVETPDKEIPIGRPIQNAIVYILDPVLRPVPIGVAGELCIGGAGVARGYLKRPELTAEKFISNPFGNSKAPRLYKTGDLVRYQADGNIEFLGRIDHQVKIRGFRVELAEVEQAIRNHKSVSDAVVIVQGEDGGDRRLVAYVVSAGDAQPTSSELRELLLEKLPAYMVPATFVMIDALPLLPNGKIDRQSLAGLEQEKPAADETFEAPRSPLEESVAKAWRDLLKLDRVGIHDNFFELGGHSLMAAKLISNLRRQLSVELNLIDVFQSPTIARMTELIYQRQTEDEADDELASLLAELESLSDEEAQERVTAEMAKGGSRAQALKLAIVAAGSAALEILSSTL